MTKKIFISYSWGTKEYQDWVVDLAKRLMNDSVDVVLDRWDLKDGNDVFHFMESMVKSDDIYRVLVLCDKNYKIKADNRDGGVGTETQIITPEIYKDQKQEKFIPIVTERDENKSAYLPIFLSSRKYIDFSNEEHFEESYEELLRNILDAPSIPKPKLGTKAPAYITDSAVNNTATNSILRTLENQLLKHPEKVNSYSIRFIDAFLESLADFEFKSSSSQIEIFGKEILDNIFSYKIFREDFLDFLLISTKPEYNLDVEILIGFFEKKNNFIAPKDRTGFNHYDFENFSFIFQELFLYTIAICMKNKNYNLVEELLYSKFYFINNHAGKADIKSFSGLYKYNENIENYLKKNFNKASGFGHLIITNLSDKISKEEIIFADVLCHFILDLHPLDNRSRWFPRTYIYKEWYDNFDFFERLSSQRHFEKVKTIFNVNTKEEFHKVLTDYENSKNGKDRIRFENSFDSLPFLHEMIDKDKIGINR
jgi:hypothetical protein